MRPDSLRDATGRTVEGMGVTFIDKSWQLRYAVTDLVEMQDVHKTATNKEKYFVDSMKRCVTSKVTMQHLSPAPASHSKPEPM